MWKLHVKFSVSKDMKKNVVDFNRWEINEQEGGAPSPKSQVQWKPFFTGREVEVGKVAAHLYVTLTVKELKISVEHGRVITTLNIVKH